MTNNSSESMRTLEVSRFVERSDAHAGFEQAFRAGGAFGLEAVRMKTEPFSEKTPAAAEFTIGMGFGKDVPCRWDFGDGWSPVNLSQPGSALVTLANTPVCHEVLEANDILLVACPDSTLKEMLDERDISSPDVFAPLIGNSFIVDAGLRAHLMSIWREAQQTSPSSQVLIDAHWLSIIARLLLMARQPTKTKSYGLTQKCIAEITEFVDENMCNSFDTRALAKIANLTVGQFARDFKHATATTPYQFILGRRLKRAQELLADGGLSLASIALECGFSSQSHMTDVFREKLGQTPGRYRKDMTH